MQRLGKTQQINWMAGCVSDDPSDLFCSKAVLNCSCWTVQALIELIRLRKVIKNVLQQIFSLRSMANKKEKEQDQNQATHTSFYTVLKQKAWRSIAPILLPPPSSSSSLHHEKDFSSPTTTAKHIVSQLYCAHYQHQQQQQRLLLPVFVIYHHHSHLSFKNTTAKKKGKKESKTKDKTGEWFVTTTTTISKRWNSDLDDGVL